MSAAQRPLLAPGADDEETGGVPPVRDADADAGEKLSAVQWCARYKWYFVATFAVALIVLVVTVSVLATRPGSAGGAALAGYQDQQTEGRALCADFRNSTPRVSAPNAELGVVSPVYLIKNANVWIGLEGEAGEMQPNTDVLLYNGTIRAIGVGLSFAGATTIDGTGKHVTPGLVDLHSHVGVYAQPELNGNSDGNEATNPTYPQVRAIDAFCPRDESIRRILRGGVTASLVLPGSANTMGGEAFAVKHNGSSVAQAQIHDAPRYMKMACGENPKNVYGSQGVTPASRMGSAWVMRQRFELAKKLAVSQDDWCALPSTTSRYPTELELDSLVALLRGSLILNVHCYTVWDMEMMIRLSKEFRFNIGAFHHAIEAWKLAETLAEEDIVTATFADSWGFKDEGYYASVRAPSILYNAGAKVVIKSDHPVVAGDTLMFEAAKAAAYGFPQTYALASVTSVPARAMRLDNRIGSLEVGKDADVVIWDRSPFLVGAKVDKVFLNGEKLVDDGLPADTAAPVATTPAMTVAPAGSCTTNVPKTLTNYKLLNAKIVAGTGMNYTEMLVEDGFITCLSSNTGSCGNADVTFNLQGGTVIAGMVNFGHNLGLAEIEQESITQDGVAQDSFESMTKVRAIDGVQFFSASHLVEAAFASGVTRTVTHPMGSRLVVGQSGAFLTDISRTTATGATMLREVTALHVALGQSAKASGTIAGSISGQVAALRGLLETAATDPLKSVVNGTIPLVVHAANADTIASTLRLLQTFSNVRIIVYGAAEAALVIPQLSAAGAAVILKGVHCFPKLWEEQRCDSSTVAKLVAAGIPTAIAPQSIDWTRNLRWEAGLARSFGLTFDQALAAVTSVPASLFGLPDVGMIEEGKLANFAAFNGDPFALQTAPQLVGVGATVLCFPMQR